jgi:hypothetical protein
VSYEQLMVEFLSSLAEVKVPHLKIPLVMNHVFCLHLSRSQKSATTVGRDS